MALRKIVAIILALGLAGFWADPACAAQTEDPIVNTEAAQPADPAETRIERVLARMPDIKVYFRTANMEAPDVSDISASLDGKALAVGELQRFEDSGEGLTYILLADVSTSVKGIWMQGVQEALQAFSDGLRERDRMILVAIGEQAEILLEGGEDAAARQKAIASLDNDEDGTAFYDAINKAILLAESKTDAQQTRAVCVAISDGIDYNDGGYTKGEVDAALADGSLPLFALGLSEVNTGANAELDGFGETARTSGGMMAVTDAAGLGAAFDELTRAARGAYVLSLKNDSNVIEAEKQTLTIDISTGGVSSSATKEIRLQDWTPDTVPPEVTGIMQMEGKNGIRLDFSEPLRGADDKGSYVVSDKDGAPAAIRNVVYTAREAEYYAELIFEEELYAGEYTVAFSGITDDSMEENALSGSQTFAFEGEAVLLKYMRTVFVEYWWVVFIAAAAALVLIVFRVIRKRKGLVRVEGKIGFGDAVEFQHHFETPDTAPASLIVTDMKGDVHKLDLQINKSLFVGRAKINNLSFDDGKMSRQHFVIEVDGEDFFLLDLNTTNGTFLNGVRISGRRKLSNNDVITAGNEKFVFKAKAGADS